MFDAYTVKKVLPRLVIAVILIQLSWFIFTGMILLTESIAYGIEALIYAPFGNAEDFTFEALFTNIGGSDIQVLFYSLVAGGAAVASFGGSIGFFALIALLALFVGVLTLLIRRILLVLLLITAPLALVAWILPNTERFWKMWWDNFTKLLLMYPIILAMVAAGRVMAKIGGEFGEESIAVVMVLGGVFLPLALIPKTFSMAGSAFAFMGGALAARAAGISKGFAARGRKRGAERWKGRGEETLKGNAFKGGNDSNWRGRANRRLQQAGHLNKAGAKPWRMRENIASAISTNTKLQRDKMKEDADYSTWMHNDGLNKAAAETENASQLRAYLNRHGDYGDTPEGQRALEEDVARVERMRKKYGSDALRQRATLQAIAGGTAYKTAGEQWKAVANASRGDRTAMQDMVAEGRDSGMGAGRVDASGAGFGDTLGAVQRLWSDQTYNVDQANDDIHKAVLKAQGPGVLTHAKMKPRAIEELMPEMQERVFGALEAVGSANTPAEKEAAKRNVDVELANLAAIYDGLASTSPQLADQFANELLGRGVTASTLDPELQAEYGELLVERAPATVKQVLQPNGDYVEERVPGAVVGQRNGFTLRQLLEARRNSPDVLDRRRELTMQERAAQGGQPAGPNVPPGGAPPGALPPGP